MANFGSTVSAFEMLLDGIARQPGSSRNLADRQLQAQRHAPDQVQKFHVDHSIAPRGELPWGKGHMGQFSMEITCPNGSLLGGTQQLVATLDALQQSLLKFSFNLANFQR